MIWFLYDEYMFYLVEYKVVKVIGVLFMVVMGEVSEKVEKNNCFDWYIFVGRVKFRFCDSCYVGLIEERMKRKNC